MNNLKKMLPVIVFSVIIFGFTGMGMATEQKTYSAAEKRELQTLPKATRKTIKNGKFQKKYENYLSDQFPGRDDWVRVQTDLSKLFGKKESNGVYFGRDHYLLERYEDEDFEAERMKQNIEALAGFVHRAEKNAARDRVCRNSFRAHGNGDDSGRKNIF